MTARRLRIGFAGDLCLARLENATHDDVRVVRETIGELAHQVDLTIANLECCITEDEPGRAVPRMASPRRNLEVIRGTGIDVLCLANNHVMDDGPQTLLGTQAKLAEFGFASCGAGDGLAAARAPLILNRSGLTIGILNATDATHYGAGLRSPGVNTLARRLLEDTRLLRQQTDIVVVVLHSDLEFTNTPAPWKVRLSRRLAERGADLVIHHHPHTLQGIEHHAGALIAYSLGNFLFPVSGSAYMADREGDVQQGVFLIADVTVGDGSRTVQPDPIPIRIDSRNRVRICTGAEREESLQNLQAYSRLIESAPELRARYLARCLQEARRFALGVYYRLAQRRFREAIGYVRAHFGTRMQRNWMRGLLTFGRY